MRKGTVLYLTDVENVTEDFDEDAALDALGFDERWTVVAAGDEGWYDFQNAQRLLIERGATMIEAVKGRLDIGGNLEIFGSPLRVFG